MKSTEYRWFFRISVGIYIQKSNCTFEICKCWGTVFNLPSHQYSIAKYDQVGSVGTLFFVRNNRCTAFSTSCDIYIFNHWLNDYMQFSKLHRWASSNSIKLICCSAGSLPRQQMTSEAQMCVSIRAFCIPISLNNQTLKRVSRPVKLASKREKKSK